MHGTTMKISGIFITGEEQASVHPPPTLPDIKKK
jgi:hypothetical protein